MQIMMYPFFKKKTKKIIIRREPLLKSKIGSINESFSKSSLVIIKEIAKINSSFSLDHQF